MTDYGVMYTQMISQTNGSYSYQVVLGELMTWGWAPTRYWQTPDALFLVLKSGTTVDAFRWKEEQVFAMAETDRRGYFELPLPLQRGKSYSWIITARGYKPILEDGITVTADPASPYELNITLQRAK